MAKIKSIVKALEDVEEKYRDLYEQDGEQYVLKGLDDSDYKAKLDEFRKNNRTLFGEVGTLKANLEKYKDIDLAKYQEAMKLLEQKDHQEDQNLWKDGKMEEVVAKRTEAMKSDYEKKISAKDEALKGTVTERDTLKRRLDEVLVNTEIQKAVERFGSPRKGALQDIMSRAKGVWKLDERGQLVPKKGDELIFGKGGEVITLDEWMADCAEEAPFLFEQSKGGGAEGTKKDTTFEGKVIDGSDPMVFGKNLEGIASGKVKLKGV